MKKAIVLKAPGTNNDVETRNALNEAGAHADVVHVNELVRGERKLDDYAVLAIPGGFSYGDDLGAGKIFSLFLGYKLKEALERFVKKGKIVLGVCNGFQVLLKSRILPEITDDQMMTSGFNTHGRFVCRWVRLKVKNDIFWFKGLPGLIELPIAHAEGRVTGLQGVSSGLLGAGQVALKYVDNPNGSEEDIAGIVNKEGNVLGMFPHPERFFFSHQHPASRGKDVVPWGRQIFRNIVRHS